MISMFILAVLALFLIVTLTDAKYKAEDNLYETTALSVSLSAIEQMMGAGFGTLESSGFSMLVGGGNREDISFDGSSVQLQVPIVTREGATAGKTMALSLTSRVERATSTPGYWLEVEYAYIHPGNGQTRTRVIRKMRSTVPSG